MSSIVIHNSEFANEPFVDFSNPENIEKMKVALEQVKSEFNKEYPLIIGGEKIYTDKKDKSLNPSNLDEVVGVVQLAEKEHADKAIKTAYETFNSWKKVSVEERASYLFKVADLIRERKFYFSVLLVYEVGKNWA